MMCTEGACPGESFCAPSGVCELKRTDGSTCSNNTECSSAHCVDGICCDAACDGVCESCRVPETFGVCSIVPAMTDPDGECGPTGYCDGTGACSGGDAGLVRDAGMSDSGVASPDASMRLDAAVEAADAGLSEHRAGCDCRASRAGRGPVVSIAMLLGLAIFVRRRR